jgi:hypothetical protein
MKKACVKGVDYVKSASGAIWGKRLRVTGDAQKGTSLTVSEITRNAVFPTAHRANITSHSSTLPSRRILFFFGPYRQWF